MTGQYAGHRHSPCLHKKGRNKSGLSFRFIKTFQLQPIRRDQIDHGDLCV